ncbi:MAG TPA: hypothetical protein VF629_03970 [Hymenobacter sp.]|jgi:hypothetical protein|uniref:hypothetical protein n=1 Tax=Hymenobacter sp. TaxID=1898978 RepID=UPI002ED8D024
MAKTLRPIQCPQCGGTQKTPLGPGLFRCASCHTEYYLDSDDVTVNVQHHYPDQVVRPVPRQPLTPKQRLMLGLCALVGAAAVAGLVFLASRLDRPGQAYNPTAPMAGPTFYPTYYVYADARQQPVYATLRTENPSLASRDSVKWTAVFFDPRTGQMRREQPLPAQGHGPDEHFYTWHTFPGGRVFLLGRRTLYQVDTRANQLVDVTETLLADQPAASSGVAQYSFDPTHEALRALTNEGQTLYYLPATGQTFADGAALYRAADRQRPRQYFYFEEALGTHIQTAAPSRLIRSRQVGQPGQANDTAAVTPGRRFFDGRVLYQDATTLLVQTALTPRRDGPQRVQRLDVRDGRVLWSAPAKPYDFKHAVRTADGFALHYAGGPDYAHGALLLTEDGREIRDFQRKRLE